MLPRYLDTAKSFTKWFSYLRSFLLLIFGTRVLKIIARTIDTRRPPTLIIIYLVLITFFGASLVKYDIFDKLGGVTYKAVLWYNVARLVIFSMFVYVFCFSTQLRRQTHLAMISPVNDPYALLRKEYDPLLGLRASAFFMVFMGHWFLVVFPPFDVMKPDAPILFRSIFSGSPWGGVWVFFTLSGYLMGKSFITGRYLPDIAGISNFFRNRALRIFPLYFLAIFLIIVLQKPEHIQLSSPSQLDALLSELLFDPQGAGAIGALWSVSTEVQFYLAIPFIHIFLAKYVTTLPRICAIMATIIIIIVASKTLSMLGGWHFYWHRHVYFPMLSNLDTFLTGYAASLIVDVLRRRAQYVKHGMEAAVVVGVIYYIVLSYMSYVSMVQDSIYRLVYLSISPVITAIVTAIIIILFEISERYRSQGILARLFWASQSFFGLLTYSLYVWHESIITNIRRIFPSTITAEETLLYFPIGLSLTTLIAYVFYRYIESWFDSMRSTQASEKFSRLLKYSSPCPKNCSEKR